MQFFLTTLQGFEPWAFGCECLLKLESEAEEALISMSSMASYHTSFLSAAGLACFGIDPETDTPTPF